jgi:cytidyltransferase-like protein
MEGIALGEDPRRPVRLFADGVFDLFHFGHARLLEQCKKKFTYVHLIVGVNSDADTQRVKGKTVMTESERGESVRHCRWVDEVICPSPWLLTTDFLSEHQIDFVCHDNDYMAEWPGEDVYGPIKRAGKYLVTQRTTGISTSDLIMRIIRGYDEYVRRNLQRGYTRKDLNVSLMRASKIKVTGKIRDLEEKLAKWKSRFESSEPGIESKAEDSPEDEPEPRKLDERIDNFRTSLRVIVERWGDKSELLLSHFISGFERNSTVVENVAKKIFAFKSLSDAD